MTEGKIAEWILAGVLAFLIGYLWLVVIMTGPATGAK
jgi:hypothetical protein